MEKNGRESNGNNSFIIYTVRNKHIFKLEEGKHLKPKCRKATHRSHVILYKKHSNSKAVPTFAGHVTEY